MNRLTDKAARVKAERDQEYPTWQETAARFSQVRETDYPITMIRAKLARDPHLENEDTRVDVLNYLLMVDESHRSREGDSQAVKERVTKLLFNGAEFETSTQKIDRLTQERRDRGQLGCEL